MGEKKKKISKERKIKPNIIIEGKEHDRVDVLWEIKYFFKEVKSFFWKVKYGFRNLWDWKEVIWYDRDWDGYYLYVLLLKKIKNMKKSHEKYSPIVEETKRQIIGELEEVEVLLRKIIRDEYFSEEYEKLEEKFGEEDWNWNFVPTSEKEESYELVDTRSEEYKEASKDAFKSAEERAIEDRNKLIELMKKIDSWWY